MAFLRASLVIICAAAASVLAASTRPIVTLDKGTFTGTTADGLNKFLGIPYAQPPPAFADRVGNLRFRLPQVHRPYVGTYNTTAFGPSCPQQAGTLAIPNGLPQATLDYLSIVLGPGTKIVEGEDCEEAVRELRTERRAILMIVIGLTLNVVAPAHVRPGSKLPVVVWIHGGGFEIGSSSAFDGSPIVNRSIALQQPVVYVSLNYRLSAFGFLASQEVKDAGVGNLGLRDQRLAFHWVQRYIWAFGGDPSKVTIWGESAGSISVSLHMLVNGGHTEGLFRAAFMESGSPLVTGDITSGQPYYDGLVERTGCSSSLDTLACLRAAPYEKLKAGMDSTPSLYSYQALALVWAPRVDGVFLVDDPQKIVQQGKVARIPFVTGDCDDEGTLFALSVTNVTTEAELRPYLSEFIIPNATDAELDGLLTLYPQDVTQGSPYDTGTQNAFTTEFKRISAIFGDFTFQAPRRFLLNNVSGKQKTWSFLSKRLKSLPVLGATHVTDLLNVYGGGDLADYLIYFATNLDPNGGSNLQWPQYTTSSPQLLTFLDGKTPTDISLDTYRVDGMELLTKLANAHPPL